METDEMEGCSTSTVDFSGRWNITETSESQSCSEPSSSLPHKTYAQKIRQRRKPVLLSKSKNSNPFQLPEITDSKEDQTTEVPSESKKREITTIREGVVLHFSDREMHISDREMRIHTSYETEFSKGKRYKEKHAKLDALTQRLKKCIEKHKVNQAVKLLNSIHI